MPEQPASGVLADALSLLLLHRKTPALSLNTLSYLCIHLKLHMDGDVNLSRPWG